jgi:hypothetical protein
VAHNVLSIAKLNSCNKCCPDSLIQMLADQTLQTCFFSKSKKLKQTHLMVTVLKVVTVVLKLQPLHVTFDHVVAVLLVDVIVASFASIK